MSGRFLEDWAELTRLAEAWNALCLAQPRPTPMMTWDWADSWWRVYGAPDPNLSPAVWVHEKEGKLSGLLPLYRAETPRGVIYRPIGTGEREADAVCSDFIAPLFAGKAEETREDLTEDLTSLVREGRNTLLLSDLSDENPWNVAIDGSFRSRRLAVRRASGPLCFFFPLPQSFDEFFSALSSHFRTQLRQMDRRIHEMGGVEIRRVEREEDLPRFWDDLVRLHQKRWNAVGQTGVFASPLFTAFHREIVSRYLRRGWLEGSVVYANGRPLAALYAYRIGGTIFIYQSGLDPEVPPKARPGLFLHIETIRKGIERGDREYDFMRGDDGYKRKFTRVSRRLIVVEAGKRTPGRILRFFSIAARERLKETLPDPFLRVVRKLRRTIRPSRTTAVPPSSP